ncbi:MAG: hypothetical protein ABFS09_05895 [Thermodesulfobacteriota bacterium]
MKKRMPSTKTERQLAAAHQRALLISDLKEEESLALRLAEGESWNSTSMHLAMLMSRNSYSSKLHSTNGEQDDTVAGRRTRQVTIRRNSFTPEFEPSRHEMRIFDSLDGIVTEM